MVGNLYVILPTNPTLPVLQKELSMCVCVLENAVQCLHCK